MSLRFTDSFDHYATVDLLNLEKWDAVAGSPAITAGAARSGVAGLRCPNGSSAITTVSRLIDRQAGWFIGVAFRYSALPSDDRSLIAVCDGGSVQAELQLTSLGRLKVRDSAGVQLGETSFQMVSNTFYYLELQVGLGAFFTEALLVDADNDRYERAAGNFVTEGFAPGQVVYMNGFTNAFNNGPHVVTAVTATTLSVAEAASHEADAFANLLAVLQPWQPARTNTEALKKLQAKQRQRARSYGQPKVVA